MWYFNYGYALILQILMLWIVYIIYFQNTTISGLKPQQIIENATANRLVIFFIDGLSAKIFFENRCQNVPKLQELFQQQGQVGIIRNRGNTNCEASQIALFAGFYHDPSLRFWSKVAASNTIFNSSSFNYGICSANLRKYIPNAENISVRYNENSDFQEDSYKMDEWSLQDVQTMLRYKSLKLQNKNRMLFLVHLLGLRLSNGTEMFYKNLDFTQHGIWSTYTNFEQTFPDKRTAYLLISDHGMTKTGYYDGSSRDELEAPFFLWGAGASNNYDTTRGRIFVANKENKRLPLHILEPIQIAPLISALLGLPPPVNNRGEIPTDVLNISSRHESRAMFINALQLLAISKHLVRQHYRGLLTPYMPAHSMTLEKHDEFVRRGDELWQQRRFLSLLDYSNQYVSIFLDCIEYYENFYRRRLFIATIIGYLGWQFHLRCQLTSTEQQLRKPIWNGLVQVMVYLAIQLVIVFVLLQRISWLIGGVFLLPSIIWLIALRARANTANVASCRNLLCTMILPLWCLAGFYDRRLIAAFYFVFGCFMNRFTFLQRCSYFHPWFLLLCGLTAIGWCRPSMGYSNRTLFVISLIFNLIRPMTRRGLQRPPKFNLYFNGLVLLIASMHILYSSDSWFMTFMARAYLYYLFYPRAEKQNFEMLIFNLNTLYALLCTSCESLIIQLLAVELELAMSRRRQTNSPVVRKRTFAMYIMMYSFYSFFILGDILAVDRFRFNMSLPGFGYYSAIMNGLIIAMKLLLPMLLVVCIIWYNSDVIWMSKRQVFAGLQIMCNGMAFVLLCRIRNFGTIWEISVSIITFIIVQALPFVLLILLNVAQYLLVDKPKTWELFK